MFRKILGILLTITGLLFAGYFLYQYFSYSTNAINKGSYNPFQDVTFPAPEIVCINYETKEFAFYLDEPNDFKQNNKFGLYIYAERQDFFEKAAELVNSNGGEWGYVLIPYNVKDRDSTKWSRVFADLNRLKLIPVIQLWDVDLEKYKSQTKDAASFLDNFDWPIKPRYISVYNEVNDKRFWYGKVDPKAYAKILDYTIDTFKDESKDYVMMNGAFNVSAENTRDTVDSFYFMKKMNEAIPGIFDKLDAWAAHPYPQPNFSGHPQATGRWSIKAYDDELNFLKNSLGVKKDLPVFITETGWAHKQNAGQDKNFLDENVVAEYYKFAYQEIWLRDPKVRAVMPFTIKYNAPFDHFSWVKEDYKSTYKQFDAIKSLPKAPGYPPKLIKGSYKIAKCD